MRRVGCAVLFLLLLGGSAAADTGGFRVQAPDSAFVGETVHVIVEARADGARLTYPDLHGELGLSGCSLSGRGGAGRFVLPYRPTWPGRHVLTVSVTSGGCGGPARLRWRPVVLDVEPAGARDAAADAGPSPAPPATDERRRCRGGGATPLPRRMRAARLALVCLLNRERRARGLTPLRWNDALRRAASRKAHRLRRRARPGEHVLVAMGEQAAPDRVLAAWLDADAHRRDLLDPRVRSVGAAVVPGPRGPLRRLGATWVLEVG